MRWLEAKASPAANAIEVATFIYEEIICRHDIVDVIHSNQRTHFVNELISQLMQKFNMKYHKITAYHPQANGLAERFNGTLKQTLAKISEGVENWDDFIIFADMFFFSFTFKASQFSLGLALKLYLLE